MPSPGSLKFTENRGQVIDDRGNLRPDLFYMMRGRGVRIYLAKDRIYYAYHRITDRANAFYRNDCNPEPGMYPGDTPEGFPHPDSAMMYTNRVEMEFVGANPGVRIESDDAVSEYTNYYLGHCPQGIRNVPGYRTVTYREIYENIDMVVHATNDGTKYDFVVRPGGDVSDIRIRYIGADDVNLLKSGEMRVTNRLGYLEEGVPYTYQAVGEREKEVPSRYTLRDGIITFNIGSYDRNRELVIDPTQEWATFYGGGGVTSADDDFVLGGDPTEVDRSGNTYIVGYTVSTNFPTTPGAFRAAYQGSPNDGFVVKFDPHGNVLFATYYGGNNDDLAHGVTADREGNIFVTGHTASTNLPIRNAFQNIYGGGVRDGFVAKFDSTGGLIWGTYSGTTFWDDGYAFAVDSVGNAALLLNSRGSVLLPAGVTYKTLRSATHPTGNASSNNDLAIVKYSGQNGQISWATFIGGSGEEIGYSAASDVNNNIIITGWTFSNDFDNTVTGWQPARAGGADCFLVKMDSAGAVKWATYYGGPKTEDAGLGGSLGSCGLATDYEGNVFIAGSTSGGFPTSPGAWSFTAAGGTADAFLVKFNPEGERLWATYIGTSGSDYGLGCAVNQQGSVLVTGYTSGTNLPTTGVLQDAPFQAAKSAGEDAFIVKLDKNGKPTWVTYFGDVGSDQGHAVAYSPYGLFTLVGITTSAGVPFVRQSRHQTTNNQQVAQGENAGGLDVFVTVFCDVAAPRVDSSGALIISGTSAVNVWTDPGQPNIRWYRRNQPADTGSTEILAARGKDTLTISDTGSYYVTIETVQGCSARSLDVRVRRETGLDVQGGEGHWGSKIASIRSLVPNPADKSVAVTYDVARRSTVQLYLVGVLGNRVATLVDGVVTPGSYLVQFDTESLASGMYYCVLETPAGRHTQVVRVVR